jgi:hypothetical protein
MAVRRRTRGLELRLQARPEFVPVLRAHTRAWLEDVHASNREIFDVLMATTEGVHKRSRASARAHLSPG